LVFFPLIIALIALLAARTANSQKSACALEGKGEKPALSSSESDATGVESKSEDNGSTEQVNPEENDKSTDDKSQEAVLPYIEPRSIENTAQDTQSDTTGNENDGQNSETAHSGQQEQVPEINPSPVEEPQAIPPQPQYKSAELLVKFKEEVSKDQIDTINKANHTTILEVIEQIDTYILTINNEAPVQEVVDTYNSLPEVEYAEPNSVYEIPETDMNAKPLE
jgi:hypothetical protein